MGRIQFTEENKRTSSYVKLPKIKLNKDENARIAIYEDPISVYVHNLRKPKVENGKPVKAPNNKGEMDYVYEFVSNPLCTGDEAILDDKGLDVKNCVLCAFHKENPEMTDAPKFKLAMNILKYATDEKGRTLSKPFQVENLVWSFTERAFSSIIDSFGEYIDEDGPAAVQKHDLILTCTNGTFQNYDMNVSPKSYYSETPERVKVAKEVIKENRFDEDALKSACGREKEMKWIDKDIEDIKDAWKAVSRHSGTAPEDLVESSEPLDEDLNSLLSDDSDDEKFPETIEDDSLSNLLGEDDTSDTSDDEDEDGSVGSFADLLADD